MFSQRLFFTHNRLQKPIYQHFSQRRCKTHETTIFQIPKHHSECTLYNEVNGNAAKLRNNEMPGGFFHANSTNCYSYGH